MNEQPIIRGHRATFPNPKALNLRGAWWSKIQKRSDEVLKLQERLRIQQQRRSELQDELRYQQEKLEDQRVAAARADKDEPDDTYLRATEKELQKCGDRIRSLQRALEQSEQEFLAFLYQGPPESVLQEIRERGRQHEQRYRELVAQAERERDALGQCIALHIWARGEDERGNDSRGGFGVMPASGPTGQLWYQRNVDWWREGGSVDPTITSASAAGLIR